MSVSAEWITYDAAGPLLFVSAGYDVGEGSSGQLNLTREDAVSLLDQLAEQLAMEPVGVMEGEAE